MKKDKRIVLFRCKICKKNVAEKDAWLCFAHSMVDREKPLKRIAWICKKCLGGLEDGKKGKVSDKVRQVSDRKGK